MDVGTLTAYLRMDTSDFEEGAQSAESESQGLSKRMGGTLAKGAKVAGAGLAAAGAAATTAAFKTAAYGDEVAKSATKMGISTDALQEMRYWADRNGISAQSMDRAVGRLNQRIGRAADGNEKYADAFSDLDVAITDSNGNLRDTETVLQETIGALRDIEDPAEQSAKASEVFGTKMARDLMPALQDGSLSLEEAAEKANELGVVMDGDALKSSERFQDSWGDVKDSLLGFMRNAATPLMEMLGDKLFPFITEKIVPAVKSFGDAVGPQLEAALTGIVDFLKSILVPAFAALTEWWEQNGPAVVEAAADLWAGLQEVFDKVRTLIQQVVGWFQSGEKETTGTFASIMAFAEKVWPKIQKIITTAVELIRQIIQTKITLVRKAWELWGERILEFLQRTWSRIEDVISAALKIIQGIIDTVMGILTGDWERAWDGIKSILSGVWDAIKAIVTQAVDIVAQVIGGVVDLIQEGWNAAWRAIRDYLSDRWEDMKAAVAEKIAEVRDTIETVLGVIREVWNMAWRKVRDYIEDRWDDIKSGVGDAMDWVRDRIATGVDAVASIWNGLKSAFAKPVNWVIDHVLNKFLASVERIAGRIPGVAIDLPRVSNVSSGNSSSGHPARGEAGGPGPTSAPLKSVGDMDLDNPDEAGGPLDAIKDLGSSAISTLRETIADVARPAIEAGISAAQGLGGRFGPLGELLGGTASHLGKQLLDWIAGVDDEAEKNESPGNVDLGGSGTVLRRLASYMSGSGVPHRLTSGYRPGDSGYHGRSRAADFAGPTPSAMPTPAMGRIFDQLANLSGLRELIYAGRSWNIIRGRRVPTSALSPGLVAQHRNHVHAAMDTGGTLSPGWNLAYNGLNRPEPLARTDQMLPVMERIERKMGDAEALTMVEHHLKALRRTAESQARQPLVTAMNRAERLAS